MQITYEPESGTAVVTCDELSRFARSKSGLSASRYGFSVSESDDADGKSYLTDHIYSHSVFTDDCTYKINGKADAAYTSGMTNTVEFIYETRRRPELMNPLTDSAFLAKAMLIAYIALKEEKLYEIRVRLTFVKRTTGEEKSYAAVMNEPTLHKMFNVIFDRALPFIKIRIAQMSEGTVAIQDMSFPYPSIRDGQRDFIIETFRSIRTKKRLLVNAPTGIGKTMSALYPAVKAIGEGFADKVFYLTAKSVTGNAAMDAAKELREQAPLLRAIMITAKDRQCPLVTNEAPFSQYNCIRGCAMTDEIGGTPYEERRDSALLELLETHGIYTPDIIAKTAIKYSLCPYELSLDLSEYCELVVCDYNYIFDKRIRFRRYFDNVTEKYVFLVDEAHNMPDRARDIYSASLANTSFIKLAETVPEVFPGDAPLSEAVADINKMFVKLRGLCETEHTVDSASGDDIPYGFFLSDTLPDFLAEPLSRFRVICDDRLKHMQLPAEEHLEKPRGYVRKLLDSLDLFDKHFTFYLELYGNRLTLHSLCLDPSYLLDEAMKNAVSTILFSATLSPIDYFSDILACPDATRLELDSPYDPSNLCIAAVDSVSTRLNDRRDTAIDAAEIISATVEAKTGNYIAYFPSYEYMRSVFKAFRTLDPAVKTAVQKQKMSIAERTEFLAQFSGSAGAEDSSVVGFCVLGGMFSEGIDLRGDKLIGSVIFGTGMPGMSSETNIIREYYEKTRENGQDYAYTYPGFNKVLQAAGRVIRSEDDRGVIVLVDDRFGERGMQLLFPNHWKHLKYVGDTASLSALLDRFWNQNI